MPKGQFRAVGSGLGKLPEDLRFLEPFLSKDDARYQECEWLKTDFQSPVWHIALDSNFSIDWGVKVGSSGEQLTSPQYENLLTFFKTWLVVQTHPDATGYLFYADRSAYNTVRRAISLIELMLLNADQLGITEYGLEALTENTWRKILQRISISCESSESVYGWSARLAAHMRACLAAENQGQLNSLLAKHPAMTKIEIPRDEWLMDFSDAEVKLMRAMLWRRDLYRSDSNSEQRYRPNIAAIAAELYADTLVGASALLPVPKELCFGERTHVRREFRAMPVTTDTGAERSKKEMKRLIACIDRSNLLTEHLAVAEIDISSLESLLPFLGLKTHRRYRSLPAEEGFSAMRRAVELFLEINEDLSSAYARLTEASQASGKSFAELSDAGGIRRYVSRRLVRFGVKHWSVSPLNSAAKTGESFFEQVRKNHGLYELMRVTAGGIQTVVGSLVARRADELLKLRSGAALDADRSRLVFRSGKKNVGEHRQKEARPIPPIAVEMIEYLEGMHEVFAAANGLKKKSLYTFSPLQVEGRFSLVAPRGPIYYRATDLFCDYIETMRDADGRRYYVRQHQLRRWFAMLFFWANSFGGAETLRWFLAHTDMQHLYHYVTDSVPGSVLRSAAAGWATAAILAERPETSGLAKLAREHFGTHDIRLVDSRRLETLVEDLLEEGRARVEPIFFDFGRHCEIGVQIWEPNNG